MKRICTITIAIILGAATISAQDTTETTSTGPKSSWGVGLGIPYGVLGSNIDLNVAPNLNASVGVGTSILAGLAYSIGAKFYLASPEVTFRPRIAAYYGTNLIVEYRAGDDKSYRGLSIGAGAQWMWGKSKTNGLDFDIIYIASTEFNGTNNFGKIKLSLGYRRGI